MDPKPRRQENALVAVKKTADAQHPVVLASANEAVAAIAEQLLKLSPMQRAFLRKRFYYETDAACAESLGIAKLTVQAWKNKDGDFIAAHDQILAQPLLHARAELLLLVQKATHTLGELLDSPSPRTRLAAAEKVLKGRDSQLLTNSVEVESGDDGDLYTELVGRLAARKSGMKVRPSTADDAGRDVVDAEFREMPAT